MENQRTVIARSVGLVRSPERRGGRYGFARRSGRAALLVGLLAFGLAGCRGGWQRQANAPTQPSAEPGGASVEQPNGFFHADLEQKAPLSVLPHPALQGRSGPIAIADVAESVTDSVVNIQAARIGRQVPMDGLPPALMDPFFYRFFGEDLQNQPRQRNEVGQGSGVIVKYADQIYVLTNYHVVGDADRVEIKTTAEKKFSGELVGGDPQSDLAVLRLQGDISGLKPLAFGDASRLRLGDVVLAIGNPFGVGQTVTMGIVSAKGRANVGIVDYEDFIQTDAAINPGNSGGALVDMEGNLVGINTAILARAGGNVGIGFAIPSNMARTVMASLVEHGEVRRGWLGVGIQDLDEELARALGVPASRGVIISSVEKDSPGERAGLLQGDVIVEVNGQLVDSTGRLRNLIAASGSDQTVSLKILRQGSEQRVSVLLGRAKGHGAQASASGAQPPSASQQSHSTGGLQVVELSEELRRRLGVPAQVTSGVLVARVDPGGTAALSGIQRGDVIAEVNRTPVHHLKEFEQEINKARGARGAKPAKALLLVYRGGRAVYLLLEISSER